MIGLARFKLRPPTRPSMRRSERSATGLFLVLALIVFLGAGYVKNYADQQAATQREQERQARQSECLKSWADRYTARANLVTKATADRYDALDQFIGELRSPGQSAEQRRLKLVQYLQRAAQYKATLAKNPIPAPPQLNC